MPTRSSGMSTKEGDEMARKRMFRLDVLDTDAFLDMPLSTQALYFHLCLRADDDGFIGNPKRVAVIIGASLDDLKLLIAKRFVLAFEDGVIVIKHWRMHNTIQNDRYVPTKYQDDLSRLTVKDNKSYTMLGNKMETKCIQNVSADIDIDLDIDKGGDKDLEVGIYNNIRSSQNKDFKEGNTYSSCSEPFSENSELEADVELIPLNDGSGWRPSISLYDEYCKLYPNVDINAAFKRIRAWCISNPTKCKTRRGVKRFINSWLSREQDAGGRRKKSLADINWDEV